MVYDCVIVGGGIAGLQAAIQLGRYKHQVLMIDSNYGRSTLCRSYHNLLGWPDGVSGQELREIGKHQAERLGVKFVQDQVLQANHADGHEFQLIGKSGEHYLGQRVLLSTGVLDRIPDFPVLLPCLGISVYVCPDCDGYEVKDKHTLVMGSGNVGAKMALTLNYWTNDLVFINDELQKVDADLLEQLRSNNIHYIEEPIQEIEAEGSRLKSVILHSGTKLQAEHAFIAYGGNEVKSALAKELGAALQENNHIQVDPRTKMTTVPNVWAAGDVVAHSEQVSIAMGDGAQAAIWIHKSLIGGK